jgi:hypothetical protein
MVHEANGRRRLMLAIVPEIQSAHCSVYDEFSSDEGQWLRLKASELEGCIQQSFRMRLQAGEILSEVKARLFGQFDRWLEEHWPDMSRSKVARLMAVWEHRESLSPFMPEPGEDNVDFQTSGNASVSWGAVERIAEDGAREDLIQEVLRRVAEGQHVGERDITAAKREVRGTKQGTRPARSDAHKALALWESDKLAETERLLSLARTFTAVTDEEVLAEVGLRELPTGKVLRGVTADFHRRTKDVGGWARVPHDAVVDVPAAPTRAQADLFTEPTPIEEVISIAEAAARLGFSKPHHLANQLTPSFIAKKGSTPQRNGWIALPHPAKGKCIVKRAEA